MSQNAMAMQRSTGTFRKCPAARRPRKRRDQGGTAGPAGVRALTARRTSSLSASPSGGSKEMFRGARSDSELTLLSKWRASCRIPLLGTSGKEVRQKYHKYQNICCYYKKWAKNYKQGGCPSTGKLLNDC